MFYRVDGCLCILSKASGDSGSYDQGSSDNDVATKNVEAPILALYPPRDDDVQVSHSQSTDWSMGHGLWGLTMGKVPTVECQAAAASSTLVSACCYHL